MSDKIPSINCLQSFHNISELEKLNTKKGDNPEKVSPFVQKTGLEPVRTFLSTGF